MIYQAIPAEMITGRLQSHHNAGSSWGRPGSPPIAASRCAQAARSLGPQRRKPTAWRTLRF